MAHRRQLGETIAAEALDTAALVVDADQQIVADGLDLGDQPGQLGPALPVAGEQDRAAGQRMGQPAAIGGVQRRAGDVQDQGRVSAQAGGDGVEVSTTTKLTA